MMHGHCDYWTCQSNQLKSNFHFITKYPHQESCDPFWVKSKFRRF